MPRNIRKAVDYLVSRSRPNGLIGDPTRDDRYTYGHGFAMLFLSQVLGEEEDAERREQLVDVLTRAVEFTGRAQTTAGGWGYVSAKDGGDFDEGSTTITQVQGLRGCRNAGIPVPKEIIDKAVKYIRTCTGPDGGVRYNSQGGGGGGRPPITAAAIACLFNAGDYDSQVCPQAAEVLRKEPRQHLQPGLRPLALRPLLLRPSLVSRGRQAVGRRTATRSSRRSSSEAGSDGSWNQDYIGPVYHHGRQPDHPATSQREPCPSISDRPPYCKRRENDAHDATAPPASRATTGATRVTTARRAAIEKLGDARRQIIEQLGHVIVGQTDVIEELLISLFSRGHCLLEGVPGLAKTLMISTLSRTLNLSFSRIQFTPDLMPADITGTDVIEENRSTGTRDFRFLEGPLFSNVILADEINRTPPKTQAALLEAMQERQVTVGRVRHKLADPFFVLATQNPIEQEGTYPLPEAQQDRFMFKVFVRYPNFDEEFEVARRTTSDAGRRRSSRSSRRKTSWTLQRIVRQVPVARSRDSLRLGAGAANPRPRAGRSRLHRRAIELGRRPAGRAIPDPRRQGPGACCKAAPTSPATTSRRWPSPSCGIAWC